jgi:electron transport complex protein RnfG
VSVPSAADQATHRVSARTLLTTLGGAGALAGALLVFAFQATQPTILANKARELADAIGEVLQDPARWDTLYVVDGALRREVPAGTDARGLERVYLGYDATGRRIGFAVESGAAGFQDRIGLIFGYDAATGRLLGMKVLASTETPGLGDKIYKDTAFVAQFHGVAAPLRGVKRGAGRGDSTEVDMITGATISSRAVIRAINDALTRLRPLLDAYREGP